LIMITVLAGLFSCQKPVNFEAEKEQVRQVLMDYFDAIHSKDLNKMNALCTDDYALFESGMVWNNDSLGKNIMKSPSEIRFTLDNFNIRVEQESGRMTYFNHGDVYRNDSLKRSIDWIESATFRKVDGKWKLEFLHSTQKK
jgi:ketosteroid isomerase-like protein